MDAIFPASNYLEESIKWADGVLTGKVKVTRKNEPGKIERLNPLLEKKPELINHKPYEAFLFVVRMSDPAELAARRAKWKAPKPHSDRGWVKLYCDTVLQADEGVDLDFLVGKSGAKVGRPSH